MLVLQENAPILDETQSILDDVANEYFLPLLGIFCTF